MIVVKTQWQHRGIWKCQQPDMESARRYAPFMAQMYSDAVVGQWIEVDGVVASALPSLLDFSAVSA